MYECHVKKIFTGLQNVPNFSACKIMLWKHFNTFQSLFHPSTRIWKLWPPNFSERTKCKWGIKDGPPVSSIFLSIVRTRERNAVLMAVTWYYCTIQSNYHRALSMSWIWLCHEYKKIKCICISRKRWKDFNFNAIRTLLWKKLFIWTKVSWNNCSWSWFLFI